MVSGTVDRYLKSDVALSIIREIAEPYLWSYELVTPVAEERSSFMYLYDDTGMSNDTKKEKPPQHALGAKFPEVDIGRISSGADVIKERGFQMRIPRNVLRDPVLGGTELSRCFNTAGFWFAEIDNTNILTAMKAGANTSFTEFSPANVWSSADASPVTDLLAFKQDMKTEGKPFRLNQVFVDDTNLYELTEHLVTVDVDGFKQQQIMGMPTMGEDYVDIPVVGRVSGVMSGMTEGSVMGVDTRNPVGETHYYNDPAYSVPSFTYKTNDPATGNVITETVPNLGYNFYQYEEDDSHDTVLQFWVSNDTIVKDSYGVLYSSSGI